MLRFSHEQLLPFCQGVFERLGVPPAEALVAASALVRADLEGVESHGISRLNIYARRLREKRINPQPKIRLEERGAILLVDGDHGLGQVVATRAVEAGLRLAEKNGIVAIAIRKSNHFGTASYYAQLACQAGKVFIGMTTSPPGIAPWGGKQAYLGTNPIAFGFPTQTDTPVIIDLSTSVVARGKIMLAAKTGQAIPKGWALDKEGRETEDAQAALQGALLPFGGAKGYALALAIEIMSGVLTGASFGTRVQNLYLDHHGKADVGHFFILLEPKEFLPEEAYHHDINQLLRELKQIPLAEGYTEILYPGERRKREYEKRLKQGIPLSREIHRELTRLAGELDLPFPDPIDVS